MLPMQAEITIRPRLIWRGSCATVSKTSPKATEFLAVTQTRSYTFWDLEKKNMFNCCNHNALLDQMEGAISGKTGFTAKAGYCYTGALERDGKCLIVTLLACGWPNHKNYKWTDAAKAFKLRTGIVYVPGRAGPQLEARDG